MEYVRLHVLITASQHEWLRKQSFTKRVSISTIVRNIISLATKGGKNAKN